jgi:hypothetical protein
MDCKAREKKVYYPGVTEKNTINLSRIAGVGADI